MKRFSLTWWLVVLPTSVVVGGTTFWLASLLTDWSLLSRLVAALSLTIVADLAIAIRIQSLAPSAVDIGPGERVLKSDALSEMARVVGGFGPSTSGTVIVRGETWRATRAPNDAVRLIQGMDVNVVGRDGLMLVVSADSR